MKYDYFRNFDEKYWQSSTNQNILKQVLGCDEVIINSDTTEADRHIGCDAIGKKLYKGDNGMLLYSTQSISLRIRTQSIYTDINLRNHISNPNSELCKMLSSYEGNSTYAKYFVQVFDVNDTKGKFAVKWQTSHIAQYFYDNIDAFDSMYKTSTNRYDIPLKDAEKHEAVIYDISSEVKEVSYNYVYKKYRLF